MKPDTPQTHYVRLIVKTGIQHRLSFEQHALMGVPSRFRALEAVNCWNRQADGRYIYWLAP